MNILNALKAAMTGSESRAPLSPDTQPQRGGGTLARAEARDAANLREAEASFRDPAPVVDKPPAPKPVVDAWEARFKRLPYYTDNRSFTIRAEFIQELAKRTGVELFTRAECRQLGELGARHDQALGELATVGHAAANELLQKLITEQAATIAAGGTPAEIPHKADLDRQFQTKRQQLRGELRAVGILTQPILQQIYTRLTAAAKRLAVELDDEERTRAAAFGPDYFPSIQLCMIVWFAITGASAEVFTPGAFCSPHDVVFGCLHHKDHAAG